MDDTSLKVKSLNSSVVLNIWMAIHNLSRQCNCSAFMWLPKISMQDNYIWSIHASLLCWKRQCKSWFYCKIRDYRNVIVSGWEGESFSICAHLRFFFVEFFTWELPNPGCQAKYFWLVCHRIYGFIVFWFCRNFLLVQSFLWFAYCCKRI